MDYPSILMQSSFLSLVIFIALKSVLFDINIATPTFFYLMFLWCIFFPLSYFQFICLIMFEVNFL